MVRYLYTFFLFCLQAFAVFSNIANEDVCIDHCDQVNVSKLGQETLQKVKNILNVINEEECEKLWKDEVEHTLYGDPDAFYNTVSQFLNATWMTYTYRDDQIPDGGYWSPRGWHLLAANYPVRHHSSGAHSLAFQNLKNPRKVVIATRGTVADATQDDNEEMNDVCAGMNFYDHPLPKYCQQFSEYQLNYFAQLVDFVDEVKAASSGFCPLFTGHSLGAMVSQMASSAFESKAHAIVFGGPGVMYPAMKAGITKVSKNIIQIYTEFDPAVVAPVYFSNQTGWDCPFRKKTMPVVCYKCFQENNFSYLRMDNNCGQCFMSEHYDGTDLVEFILLNKERPTCTRFPENIAAYQSKLHIEQLEEGFPYPLCSYS